MIIEYLHLLKKYTATLIEQTKKKHKMRRQMQIFSFNPPINLAEERKWLLAVTSFERRNSVFNITNEKIVFQLVSFFTGELPTI